MAVTYFAHIFSPDAPIESAVTVDDSGYTASSVVQLAAGPTTLTQDVSHLSIDGMINVMRTFASTNLASYLAENTADAENERAQQALGMIVGSPDGH